MPGEPLWLDSDTDAVLAFLREETLSCPGCGQPRDETMDPDAEEHYRARAMRCHACAARERLTKKFSVQESGGLYFVVERAGDPRAGESSSK